MGGRNCPRTGMALISEWEVGVSVFKGILGAESRYACPGGFEA